MGNQRPLLILIIFGLTSIVLMWLVGRMVKRQIAGDDAAGKKSDRMALSQLEVDAIVSRGLATPAELFLMEPERQRILAQTALMMVTAAQQRPGALTGMEAPETFCPHCGTKVENFPAALPWKAVCVGCQSELVLRRDGPRLLISYKLRSSDAPAAGSSGTARRTSV
ncbi:MAG: hypothetical protein IT357_03260 [Gemmatimonadaceae bacterium]|nr:hypothetical protein [Gemmatimonadaceae bacterium]